MALLSKSFFETNLRVAGAVPDIGDVVPLDRYLSTNKRLSTLGSKDALFLVTVRPPDEELWLVAILEKLTFKPTANPPHWGGASNTAAVVNIDSIRDALVFDNGKGIVAKPGRLGMSLQTPRILAPADVALLRGTAATAPPLASTSEPATDKGARSELAARALRDRLLVELAAAPTDTAIRERAARACLGVGDPGGAMDVLRDHFVHFNAHDLGPLPCLCRRCLVADVGEASTEGVDFLRDFAIANGRVLHFWLPLELASERKRVAASVAAKLRDRLRGQP